jgi:hypothetical protein
MMHNLESLQDMQASISASGLPYAERLEVPD